MLNDPEFKNALLKLPEIDKVELILNLLKYDMKLAKKLHYKLANIDTPVELRKKLEEKIINDIERYAQRYYTPGYLLMEARSYSGEINSHKELTKDKYGEISLSCIMLRKLLELNNEKIKNEKYGKAYTLCIYIIAKVFKILLLMQKQHIDLHLDFKEDLIAIGRLIGDNDNLMKTAIHNGFDVNWLIRFDIPENIDEIYKNLRQNGLIR